MNAFKANAWGLDVISGKKMQTYTLPQMSTEIGVN